MDLILAFAAGLLTLINPCVLPVLPLVLASAAQAHRWGPVALMAGMSASFVAAGLLVAAAGQSLGLDEERMVQAGALLMMAFGAVLLVPSFSTGFATATAGIAARADAGIDRLDRGPAGLALGGAFLGLAWSPCIGPTLGGAIALASQGENLLRAGAVMLAFAAGVSALMLAFAYGARAALLRRRAALRALAVRSRPILGAAFLIIGLATLTGALRGLEMLAVRYLPPWLQDLSVSI
ncbi:cytochrome c biogenesis CcdA family protein [Frigidibacter oleivorans]|uniref:cytochrome c biogenesis CcdA family protein n=1 Tax=Frigidibacter oleivorans TaxID=2487129 RepID=UPI000F8CF7FF|nr:cytochrome c biogenesis protein CcdA [Frigidibacter oleivorans]